MRICCVIASLGSGGAERVMVELCRSWTGRGDQVTLLTLDNGAADFYDVPANVERRALDVAGQSVSVRMAIRATLHRRRIIRCAIIEAHPDVVVSFTDRTNVLVVLASYGLGIPVVISERIDPRRHNPGTAWRALRRLTYFTAPALVVQTESVATWARRVMPSDRVFVIPNPVRPVMSPSIDDGDRRAVVVGVGRLVRAKGFDILIRAFALLHARFPDWRLVVYGEGPERESLTALAASLLPDGVVRFPGRTSNPDTVLRESRVFALPSRNEGFPNALLEAMANGCACVAADCLSGPSDLLSAPGSGLLVPVDDIDALAKALELMLRDAALRSALGTVAEQSTRRYAMQAILAMWDRVFSATAGRAREAA